jgi:hydrogenase expression/formation protein HypC
MCLAIPMEVINLEGDRGEVESGGVRYQISFRLLPDAQPGDFVIVHAGFAIQKLDTEDAAESIRLFRELDALEDETENR